MRRENKGKSKCLRFVLIRLSISESPGVDFVVFKRINRVLRGLLIFVLSLLVHQDILERNVVENNNNHHAESNFSQNHDQHLDKPEAKINF